MVYVRPILQPAWMVARLLPNFSDCVCCGSARNAITELHGNYSLAFDTASLLFL